MPAWARLTGAALLALVAQAPQFRGGVDVVRFDVVVLDKDRHPIAGLTAQDFHVTESGQALRIAGFHAVTIPDGAPPPSPPPARADLTRETVTNHVDGPGRLVVLFLGASIRNGGPILTARAIANAAIDALGPHDLGAVLFASGIAGFHEQDLTKDRARLKTAVASAQMGATADLSGGACFCGLCEMERLTAVIEALGSSDDYRRMILFVGHNLRLSERPDDPPECRGRFRILYDRLMHAIDRGSVTIHVFDPNGLETGAVGADSASKNAPHETAESRLSREGDLRTLPEYTGGRAVIDANEQERFVPAIFSEGRTYYLLAVERGPARKNGSAHVVKIGVTRPDAIVVSRASYFDATPADRANASSDPLERALTGLLPRPDLPLRMTLAPGSKKGSSIDVTLATPLSTAARADVLLGVFDEFAKQVGSEKAKVDLPVRGSADAEWTLHLNPKPGRYEIRAAVRIGDRVGSIIGHVVVSSTAPSAANADTKKAPVSRVRTTPSEETAAVLQQAAAYLEQYSDPSNGLLLDEKYTQQVDGRPPHIRELRSELLIIPDATEGWLQFRDVLAVDGKAVADRTDRLMRLFASPATDARDQARRIADEGARYNISGAITLGRTMNLPMAALLYLRGAAQLRSDFQPQGRRGPGGQRLSFTELGVPTLIGVNGGEPATGTFWVDRSGRVIRSELHILSRTNKATAAATIRVEYAYDAKTQLMLPTLMREHYMVGDGRRAPESIDGEATYSNPRQFRASSGGG